MMILAYDAFKRLELAAKRNRVTAGYLADLLILSLKPELHTLPLDYKMKLKGKPVPSKKYDSAYVKMVLSNATNLVRLVNISRASDMVRAEDSDSEDEKRFKARLYGEENDFED